MAKWIKGCTSPNPGGRPRGSTSHWQRPADRIRFWLNQPSGETIALYEDKKALGKLSNLDALIVARIANSLRLDGGADFDRLLDKGYGRCKEYVGQVIAQTITPVEIEREADEKAEKMLMALAQRVGVPAARPNMLTMTGNLSVAESI